MGRLATGLFGHTANSKASSWAPCRLGKLDREPGTESSICAGKKYIQIKLSNLSCLPELIVIWMGNAKRFWFNGRHLLETWRPPACKWHWGVLATRQRWVGLEWGGDTPALQLISIRKMTGTTTWDLGIPPLLDKAWTLLLCPPKESHFVPCQHSRAEESQHVRVPEL